MINNRFNVVYHLLCVGVDYLPLNFIRRTEQKF
jgi:hypothetical protein